jgi:uncharacterized protein (DUF433 family)
MHDNAYLELRNDAYYIAGTRIGLDVVVHDFRNGSTAESILDAYPSIGSLAKICGVIAFVLGHPAEIETYLEDQARRYEDFRAANPLPVDMRERFERGRTLAGKS